MHYPVVIPRSMVRIRPVRFFMAGWPSGLRRQFKALVSSEARVRISLQSLFDPFPPWGMQKMRHPGIEPGPPRWQRGIITTRLMTHACLSMRFARSALDVESGTCRSKQKRSPVVTIHRTDMPGYGPAILPLSSAAAFPCSVAGLRRFTAHYQPRGPRLRANPAVDQGLGSDRS